MKIIEITEGAQFTGYYKDEKKNVWTYPDTMDTKTPPRPNTEPQGVPEALEMLIR